MYVYEARRAARRKDIVFHILQLIFPLRRSSTSHSESKKDNRVPENAQLAKGNTDQDNGVVGPTVGLA